VAALFAALHATGRLESIDQRQGLHPLLNDIMEPGGALVLEGRRLKAIGFCHHGAGRVVHNTGLSLAPLFMQRTTLSIVQVDEAFLCFLRTWVSIRVPFLAKLLTTPDRKRGQAAADARLL